jgi:hypothetical protein
MEIAWILLKQYYYVPLAIFAIFGLILGFFIWRNRQSKVKMPDENSETVRAYVITQKNSGLMIGKHEDVPKDQLPDNSIERRFGNEYVHLLKRDKKDVISLIEIEEEYHEGETPSDLYDSLKDPDSANLFCQPDNPYMGMIGNALLWLDGGLIFLTFIIYSMNFKPGA